MVKLNSKKRQEIYKLMNLGTLPELLHRSWFEANVSDLAKYMFGLQCRIAAILLLMETYGLFKRHDYKLLQVESYISMLMALYGPDNENDAADYFEVMMELLDMVNGYGQMLFYDMLKDTGWIVRGVTQIEDWNTLPDEVLSHSKDAINLMRNLLAQEGEPKLEPQRLLEKRMKKIGCGLLDYHVWYEMNYYSMVVIYHEGIKYIFDQCEKQPEWKEHPLYKEIDQYLETCIFGRYYADFDEDDKWVKVHVMGVIYAECEEDVGYHQLNPEGVVALMLADMAAKELLSIMKGDMAYAA